MARKTPDIIKPSLRLLIENRSAADKSLQQTTDKTQQEKTEDVKKITTTELEQPPQLKAYIKYPTYDFF